MTLLGISFSSQQSKMPRNLFPVHTLPGCKMRQGDPILRFSTFSHSTTHVALFRAFAEGTYTDTEKIMRIAAFIQIRSFWIWDSIINPDSKLSWVLSNKTSDWFCFPMEVKQKNLLMFCFVASRFTSFLRAMQRRWAPQSGANWGRMRGEHETMISFLFFCVCLSWRLYLGERNLVNLQSSYDLWLAPLGLFELVGFFEVRSKNESPRRMDGASADWRVRDWDES